MGRAWVRGLASWSGALVGPGRTIFELTQKNRPVYFIVIWLQFFILLEICA